MSVDDNLAPPSNIFSIEYGLFKPASISHFNVCGTSDTCVGYSFLIIVNISSVLYLFNKRTVNPSITARKITLSPEI